MGHRLPVEYRGSCIGGGMEVKPSEAKPDTYRHNLHFPAVYNIEH